MSSSLILRDTVQGHVLLEGFKAGIALYYAELHQAILMLNAGS